MKTLLKFFVVLSLILLLVGVAVWFAPASVVLRKADALPRDFHFDQASGTLWNAELTNVKWHDLMLGKVSWDFMTLNHWKPPDTTWKVQGKGPDYELSMLLDVEGKDAKVARFLQGYIPAGWVDLHESIPFLYLSGQMHLNLEHLALNRYSKQLVNGTVQWQNAGLTGLVDESLDTINIELKSEKGITKVEFSSDENVELMIVGEAEFSSRHYNAMVLVKARRDRQAVIDQLAHLGTIREDGSLEISLEGEVAR